MPMLCKCIDKKQVLRSQNYNFIFQTILVVGALSFYLHPALSIHYHRSTPYLDRLAQTPSTPRHRGDRLPDTTSYTPSRCSFRRRSAPWSTSFRCLGPPTAIELLRILPRIAAAGGTWGIPTSVVSTWYPALRTRIPPPSVLFDAGCCGDRFR